MSKSMPRLAFFAMLVLTLLVYAPGLGGPLLFDDDSNLAPVAAWLEGRIDAMSVLFGNNSGALGRPVAMASFMANVAVMGPGVWGLKLGNLLVHLVNGVLVLGLFKALIRGGALTGANDRVAAWVPWLGASLWLLHPLHVSTVLYVVQRMAMLSALFMLLALLAYVYGRLALMAGRRRHGTMLLAVTVPLCTVLAALSKENGILAPSLCALVELFVFRPAAGARRPWPSTAFIAVALVVPALAAVGLTLGGAGIITDGYANRTFTLAERVLTQFRVLWDYVGALLLPNGPEMGIYHDDYPISRGLFDPATTALAIAAWAVVAAVAWRWRTRVPGLALGLGIFLVGQALESTVFPLLLYFEHRNYLPSVGLVWATLATAVYAIDTLGPRIHKLKRLLGVAACALVLVLAVATFARSTVWRTHHAIMQQALGYHPDSRWLRLDLIGEAIGQRPPDFDAVRMHSRHLYASPEPSTRRLGAIELVLVDCMAGEVVDPVFVRAMFEGRPEPLEADLIAAFQLLGLRISNQHCAGLSTRQLAIGLTGMLDRSQLDADASSIQLLRKLVVQLRSEAGHSRTNDPWRNSVGESPSPAGNDL